MSNTTDSILASTIDKIAEQLLKQHGINKAFFLIINELLKDNAASTVLINELIAATEGGVDSEKIESMKDLAANYLIGNVERHQQMSEAMLDAMRGDLEQLERKLNEIFRDQ